MQDAAYNEVSRQGDRETPASCFRALWSSVLEAGLDDALRPFPQPRPGESTFRHTTRVREWERNTNWIGSRDFRLVCEMAGIEPEFVIRFYEAARDRRLRKTA